MVKVLWLRVEPAYVVEKYSAVGEAAREPEMIEKREFDKVVAGALCDAASNVSVDQLINAQSTCWPSFSMLDRFRQSEVSGKVSLLGSDELLLWSFIDSSRFESQSMCETQVYKWKYDKRQREFRLLAPSFVDFVVVDLRVGIGGVIFCERNGSGARPTVAVTTVKLTSLSCLERGHEIGRVIYDCKARSALAVESATGVRVMKLV